MICRKGDISDDFAMSAVVSAVGLGSVLTGAKRYYDGVSDIPGMLSEWDRQRARRRTLVHRRLRHRTYDHLRRLFLLLRALSAPGSHHCWPGQRTMVYRL